MFSKLFKQRGSVGEGRRGSLGTSIAPQAQRRFARGVDCNLKLLIRGDRNAGKSALFFRLQNAPLPPEYQPTDEIQVANISWKYKVTDDIVKVEVWDVVDKGKPKAASKQLKGVQDPGFEDQQQPCLDASFVDVYKGAHGVVLIFDVTKPWTFDYVQKQVEEVPAGLPILIMANFKDKHAEAKVDFDQVTFFVEHLDRGEGGAPVLCGESCIMQDFGLHLVNRFLNIPYLLEQRRRLQAQLETNQMETEGALQEIKLHGPGSQEQDYKAFLERKQKVADAKAAELLAVPDQGGPSGGSSRAGSQQVSPMSSRPTTPGIDIPSAKPMSRMERMRAKLSSFSSGKGESGAVSASAPASMAASRLNSRNSSTGGAAIDVDNFVPDDALDDSFFGDSSTSSPIKADQPTFDDSGDEGEGNPMVAIDEDLDEDDLDLDIAGDASDISDDDGPGPSGGNALVAGDDSDVSDFDVSDDGSDSASEKEEEKAKTPPPAKPKAKPVAQAKAPAKGLKLVEEPAKPQPAAPPKQPAKQKNALDAFLDSDDDEGSAAGNPLVAGDVDSNDDEDNDDKEYDPLAADMDLDFSDKHPVDRINFEALDDENGDEDGAERKPRKKKKKKKEADDTSTDGGGDSERKEKKKKKKKKKEPTDEESTDGSEHKKKKKKKKKQSADAYDAI